MNIVNSSRYNASQSLGFWFVRFALLLVVATSKYVYPFITTFISYAKVNQSQIRSHQYSFNKPKVIVVIFSVHNNNSYACEYVLYMCDANGM